MAKFVISTELFKKFSTLKVGTIIVKDFDNQKSNSEIIQKLRETEQQIRKELSKESLAELENISSWRAAYSSFGAKPKKYKSSVEALLRRVLEGEELPSISPLVDIYNYISIKYKLPLGADDLNKVKDDIKLTFASGKETFQAINSDEIKNPETGEIIYRMGDNVLCRRWNWRESELTKITSDSKDVILYCESLLKDDATLHKALEELQSLVGGEINLLDAKNNSLDLETLNLSSVDFDEVYQKEVTQEVKAENKEKGENSKKRDSKDESKDHSLAHWTDVTAEKIIREKGNKGSYTVASGITPSGVVHIGNFREIITVDLVKRALEKRGKRVRFIYSWDDFDVFRKVPKNMPQQEKLQQELRKSIVDVFDPYNEEESYARHNEVAVEEDVKKVGISPEFIYQAKQYRAGKYAEDMKFALKHTDKIKEILNQFRKEPLADDWLPIAVFSPTTLKDDVKNLTYDGEWTISYEIEDGIKESIDFREGGNVKLKWRIDWPMRWNYEKVDFEPGGKDHSTVGGSYDTGKLISKAIWNFDAPTYIMYDFINVRGASGKMSSSKGDVITLNDVLEVYEPEVTRYLFAGTRPNREFSISFDIDILAVYEEFDKVERVYYGMEEVNDKKKQQFTVAYELSAIGEIPKTMPYQPSFRHLTTLLQINNFDINKVIEYFEHELKDDFSKNRLRTRAECAANWIKKYAPEEFKFSVQESSQVRVEGVEKEILHQLAEKLVEKEWTDKGLHEEIYVLCKNHEVSPKEFFTTAYKVLINKEKGPRLASFILEIGREKVAELFKKV